VQGARVDSTSIASRLQRCGAGTVEGVLRLGEVSVDAATTSPKTRRKSSGSLRWWIGETGESEKIEWNGLYIHEHDSAVIEGSPTYASSDIILGDAIRLFGLGHDD
jgi:hypothetical protein